MEDEEKLICQSETARPEIEIERKKKSDSPGSIGQCQEIILKSFLFKDKNI